MKCQKYCNYFLLMFVGRTAALGCIDFLPKKRSTFFDLFVNVLLLLCNVSPTHFVKQCWYGISLCGMVGKAVHSHAVVQQIKQNQHNKSCEHSKSFGLVLCLCKVTWITRTGQLDYIAWTKIILPLFLEKPVFPLCFTKKTQVRLFQKQR